MSDPLAGRYEAYYRERDPGHVYPVEFVVRAFLGSYPRLKSIAATCAGGRVLDLGFGDGRNMPLLANLGLHVYGVEIAEDIVARATERMRRLGVPVDARVGRNHRLPFDEGFFDHVVACHSCYYLDPGTEFADNVREIARVLRTGGRLVFSAPMDSSYIFRGARNLGGGRREVTDDPYGLRNGSVLQTFAREDDIVTAMAGSFKDLRIGSCRNDFWGIEEHVWTVVCERR